jgi:hypothetical protein
MELTTQQRDVLRHATNWPAKDRRHFCAGHVDADTCNELDAIGLLSKRQISFVPGPVFIVTKAGFAAMARAMEMEEVE